MDQRRDQEILLVRHPEIDRGGKSLCYGQLDLGITPLGEQMVLDLVERARRFAPEALISSDLQRCMIPARAISQATGTPVEADAAWREISMGDWEGLTWEEVEAASPERIQNWMTDYIRLAPPNGETYAQLFERVGAAFERLTQRPESRIWVMTHGGVIRSVVCRLLGVDLARSWSIETAYAAGALLRRSGTTWKLTFTAV